MKTTIMVTVTIACCVGPVNASYFVIEDGYFGGLSLENDDVLLMTGGAYMI